MNQPNFDMAVPRRDPDRALPKGKMWLSHRGKKAKRRQMRQRAAVVMRSKDPATVAVLCDLAALADGMPADPYEELYPIICETLSTAEEEGRTWAEVAASVVTMFDTASNGTAEA